MIEVEINGVKRGFKFGTYTFKLITEITGITDVNEIFGSLSGQNLGFLPAFYFACAKHYSLSNKQPVDFTEVDVADWIDEMGVEKAHEVLSELVKAYTVKNQKAPQEPGPQQ